MNKEQQIFWEEFKKQNSNLAEINFGHAWGFGDSSEMADRLANLVLKGEKTTTTGSLIEYEIVNEKVPEVDMTLFDILLNGSDKPVAILRTTNIFVTPFSKVTEEHAYKEGEGDKTLSYWRMSHETYWKRIFKELNIDIDIPTMDVVCEEFEVFWKP
ncbi:ASCH domain-containing protein [Vagococcus elongatus]|uniref:ASCH domain-containing protein n=1 Tax=Vagococcus elongatus TaxID=180344 RepID=A0A430ANK5_9ENTE|nr:ASCH domain-containing protein [Vagococcus elongatus]RSU09691.1 hypothetical protein CBF29_10965 [Vagococcus elongatus]